MFPPNMMAYANSAGDLDTNIYIPKEKNLKLLLFHFLIK